MLWHPQPVWPWWAVALLAWALLALLVLGPLLGKLDPRRQITLLALRLGVVVLVVVALVRPGCVSTDTQRQSAALLVLFDQSRSMLLPHVGDSQTRWNAQASALRAAEPWLARLARDLEVKVYAYDTEPRAIRFADGKLELPAAPTGAQTDLAGPLYQVLQQERGNRLAAAILLGDGAQTAYQTSVEPRRAAEELVVKQTPLFTVAFGSGDAAGQVADVAVVNFPEQRSVFVKNELVLRGVVQARGYVNTDIPVQLVLERATGEEVVLATRVARPTRDDEPLDIEFSHVPSEVGQFTLSLRVEPRPREQVLKNNSKSMFLTVLDGGLRVLYLYGNLAGEQRLLRPALAASANVNVDDLYVDPKLRATWPVRGLDAMLAKGNYDVFLLEDVHAQALGPANLQALAQQVDGGKGLMMLGGYHSFGPGGYFGGPLDKVLPVTLRELENLPPDSPPAASRDLHLWDEVAMLPTLAPASADDGAPRAHPILRLAADPDENLRLWRRLPKLNGANKITLKDRARLLAETPDKSPLLAAGEYGGGRVLAFAGDSTRRWRQHGFEAEHRRFWRQAILWLAARENQEKRDAWIQLAQRRFPPGAEVAFTTGVQAGDGQPVPGVTFAATLARALEGDAAPGGAAPTPLALAKQEAAAVGKFKAPAEAGVYVIEVNADTTGEGGAKRLRALTRFEVLDEDIELGTAAADPDQLARFAKHTAEFGGRPVAPEQLPDLLRDLLARPPELETEVQTEWRLGDTARDAWAFVLAFTLLLGAEWFLRKRWGLV